MSPTSKRPTVAQNGPCQCAIPPPGDLSVTRKLVLETGIVGPGLVPNRCPRRAAGISMSRNPAYKRLAVTDRTLFKCTSRGTAGSARPHPRSPAPLGRRNAAAG